MSKEDRIAWYAASLVYGLVALLVGVDSGYFSKAETRLAAAVVFGSCWLVGVGATRRYLRVRAEKRAKHQRP